MDNVWKINGGLTEDTQPVPGEERESTWLLNEGISPKPEASHKAEQPVYPKAHADSHYAEGNDPIDPDQIGAVKASTAQGMADAAQANAIEHSDNDLNTHKASGDHDSRYYSKTNLQTSGQAVVDWNNVSGKPNFADPSWKTAVANRAALPLTGNQKGDQRCVLDDGDGKSAMYACIATTGTVDQQWSKTGDVDWSSDEANRVIAENARVAAESTRNTAETARANAESTRNSQENARVTAENNRASAETSRVTAESSRVSVENSRVSAETNRSTAETARVSAETGRVNAETARVGAENTRQTNETSRNTAETARQQTISNLVAKGNYDNTVQYYKNNIVKYIDGCGYMCIQDSKGNLPTNAAYWQKIADKGTDGVGGDMLTSTYDPTKSGKVLAAQEADHAASADSANNANHATTADSAGSATTASNADHATNADNATNSEHATSADSATNADHAATADSASTAGSAGTAANADNAGMLDNQEGSYYLDRSNHTGEQAASTITDFQETVSANTDVIAATAMLNAGTPINVLSNTYYQATLESFNNTSTNDLLSAYLKGYTIVNLLGKDGNCEDVSKWSMPVGTCALDSTNKVFGSNGFKLTVGSSYGELKKDITNLYDKTKYYCLSAYFKNGNATTGIKARLYDNSVAKETGYTTITANFERKYVKVPANFFSGTNIYCEVLPIGSSGQYGYVDGIMVNEITATEYADANYVPPAYCDSVQHLRFPTVKNNGKNLFDKSIANLRNDGYTLNDSGVATTNAGGGYTRGYYLVKENTQYTVSGCPLYSVYLFDANKRWISRTAINGGNNANTFTTPVGCRYVDFQCVVATFTPNTVQLEEGAVATPYEPNRNETIVFPIALAEGETIEYENGKAMLTELWQKDVVLDGSLAWALESDFTGYKRIRIPTGLGLSGNNIESYITKYDGKLLKRLNYGTANSSSDEFTLDTRLTDGLITIADTDSGWGETYTPSVAEIQAYFYGWKLNNGTFGTPYNGTGTKTWTTLTATDNTGAVTICPTAQAIGIDNYKLSYKLATSRTYEIQPNGGISLAEGMNNLEVKSGFVLGELLTAMLVGGAYYTNHAGTGGYPQLVPTRLKNKLSNFIQIYKNGVPDYTWHYSINDANAFGTTLAYCHTADYDPTATYTVDYEILHEALDSQAQTVTINSNGSLRDSLNSAIQNISAVQEDVGQIRNEELPMKIAGLSPNMHMEVFERPFTNLPPATAWSQVFTFQRAFKKTPIILCSVNKGISYSSYVIASSTTESTTGFTSYVFNTATANASGTGVFLVIGE